MDIYIDESGYNDLMHAATPVFVVATTNLDEATAQSIIDSVVQDTNIGELHFTEQKEEHFELFGKLVARLAQDYPDNFCVGVVHKPYALFTKLISLWINPYIQKVTGVDPEFEVRPSGFASMCYVMLEHELGRDRFHKILRILYEMLSDQSKSTVTFDSFWKEIEALAAASEKFSAIFADRLLTANKVLGGIDHLRRLQKTGVNLLDLFLTTERQCMAYWQAQGSGELLMYHDEQSDFENLKWLWKEIAADTGPQQSYEVAGVQYAFPLRVKDTVFIKSSHPSIQLCDVVAGAVAESFKPHFHLKTKSELMELLKHSGLERLVKPWVWPSYDPADWSNDDGTTNYEAALNHVVEQSGVALDGRKKRTPYKKAVQEAMDALRAKDYKKALGPVRRLAEEGNTVFQIVLGCMFDAGLGLPRNEQEAKQWWQRAAREEDPDCAFRLALYLVSKEHKGDPQKIIVEFEREAQSGNPDVTFSPKIGPLQSRISPKIFATQGANNAKDPIHRGANGRNSA